MRQNRFLRCKFFCYVVTINFHSYDAFKCNGYRSQIELASHHKVELICVSEHKDIESNEKPDECTLS